MGIKWVPFSGTLLRLIEWLKSYPSTFLWTPTQRKQENFELIFSGCSQLATVDWIHWHDNGTKVIQQWILTKKVGTVTNWAKIESKV